MPQKAENGEGKPPKEPDFTACPTCGTRLLKSGYCPKCHRKKDGTPGKQREKKTEKKAEHEPNESGKGGNVADFSIVPNMGRDDLYLCEGCRAPVHYLQRKCRKCGIYLDWRGTEAENDPDVILCPQCGAFCGYAEDNPLICPHCRFTG